MFYTRILYILYIQKHDIFFSSNQGIYFYHGLSPRKAVSKIELLLST